MWVFAALTKPFFLPAPPDSWERYCLSSGSDGGQMFEVDMKHLTLIINDQGLDCTWWVALICVGNSTSVVRRALSNTWGLISLHPAGEKWLIFLNSASSGGCAVPIYVAICLLERKRCLGQSREKAKGFNNKELWQPYSEVWSEGKCVSLHCPTSWFKQFPLASPRRVEICSVLCVSSPWHSPLCDLFLLCTIHWASGKAGAGIWAALGLFQFIKICCCHLDKYLRREGNPLNSASSNSCSYHPWQQSCPQRELDSSHCPQLRAAYWVLQHQIRDPECSEENSALLPW